MIIKKCRGRARLAAGLLASLLTGIWAFCGTGAMTAQAAESTVLRVAFPELEGISEHDQYGNHTGLLVDYLNEISKYTGWEYEYVFVENEDMIPNFLEGQYDLMGGAFYSPGYENYFAYPDYSTGRSRAVLLCRREDESLQGYDLKSLNGKTIGLYENATEKIRYLKEFLAGNDLDCELRYYSVEDMNEEGNLYRKLRDGEVDLLLGNDLEVGGEFRMVTSFQAQPYYIVTTAGNTEILNQLNMALRYIVESTPTFAEETYSAHFPDIKLIDLQLNDREQRYIVEKGIVTVAVPENWHPLYCVNNPTDHHRGMLPELVEQITSFSGMQFNFVLSETYEESIRMVQEGEADILGIYLGGEEQAFSDDLVLSRPYISLGNMVLKNKSVSYPHADLTCGILKGRTLPANFGASEIHSYETISELVRAVNSGEVDYIYGASAMMEQEMQSHRYVNVVPVTQASDSTSVAFAIPKPTTPELLTILNKSIGSISTKERAAMLDRNLVSVGYSNLTLQELIYANPLAFILILTTILLLVTATILMIIRSRMRNTLLQGRLDAAEAKSLAKSEFLSKMSHEIRTPMNAIVGLADLACMEQDIPLKIEEKLKKIRSSSEYLLSLINDILDMSRIENDKMVMEQHSFSLSRVLEDLEGMMSLQAEQKGLKFEGLCRISHDRLTGDSLRLRQILTNLLSNAIKFTAEGGTVTLRVEEKECDGQTADYRFSVRDTGVGIPLEDQERIFAAFEQLVTFTSRSAGTGLGLPISSSIAKLMGGELKVKSEPGKGSEFYMTLKFPLDTEEVPAGQTPKGQEKSLKGMRVLLAEDNDLNAEIVQELLGLQGVEVRRAVNGQEAVDMFLAGSPGEYQVILMDIRMPVKDGHEAAREIRSSGRPDADAPIIALTANSFTEDVEKARAAGMNGFISKPVDTKDLFSVLRENL